MGQLFIIHKTQTFSRSFFFFFNPRNRKCFGQSCVNRPEAVHEILRFLFLSHLLYMECDSCNACLLELSQTSKNFRRKGNE